MSHVVDLFKATGVTAPRHRAKPLVRMHLTDAGDSGCVMNPPDAYIACFKCHKCGHSVKWVQVNTTPEGRRGLPCPKCNDGAPEPKSFYGELNKCPQ